jgi:hypothetical protein
MVALAVEVRQRDIRHSPEVLPTVGVAREDFLVVLYLTRGATRVLLIYLASLADSSEVIMTYSPSSDGTDPAVQQVWTGPPRVDETGESFIGHYPPAEIERLAREDVMIGDVGHTRPVDLRHRKVTFVAVKRRV